MVEDEVGPHPRARRHDAVAEPRPEERPPAVHHDQGVDERGDLIEGDEGLDDPLLLARELRGLVRLQVEPLEGLVLPEPAGKGGACVWDQRNETRKVRSVLSVNAP